MVTGWVRFLTSLAPALLAGLCFGQGNPPPRDRDPHAEVLRSEANDTSPPLRDIRPIPPRAGEIIELPRKLLPNRVGSTPAGGDGSVQTAPVTGPATPSSAANFEGIGNVNGVLPPDTNGDVGPNHYVQTVNLSYAVFNKSGTKLLGPANINTLWSGFQGACSTRNDGDPIVLYDRFADRWLVSQFALPSYPFGPFYQCIAVSQTPDPTGAWHRYQFLISNNKLNDYPKFGVWPDGYYMTVNQFNQLTLSWAGARVVAFERDKMLNGQAATGVAFDLYNTDPNLGGMLPSHLNGPNPPPAGSPNYVVQVDDNAWGYSPDQLQVWEFRVNWASPSSSTFTRAATLATSSFDSNLCGYARNCIPQPGTSVKVDALSDRLMYRLQYRNFGTYETMVVSHTVDANGSDQAGVRWYELRKETGGWSIRQQSTYAPDASHRWMSSIAMNGNGDIALGFSVSNSSTVYPSIRATGRLAEDTLNSMTQGELVLQAGTGSQTHSSGRWGDYSSMSVDPSDDCSFWYTQEYYKQGATSAGWSTFIGSFKLRDCTSSPPSNTAPSVSIANPGAGATVSGTVQVQITATDNETTTPGALTVRWRIDSGAWQTAIWNGAYYVANWNTTGASNGSHTIYAEASDGSLTGSSSNSVTVSNPTMHVGDLDATTAKLSGQRWRATVAATILNSGGGAVSGATVSGSWSTGGSGACTTGSSGTCAITSGTIAKSAASTTFTVTNVAHASYSYDAAANTDPDGSSNGTSIVINRP